MKVSEVKCILSIYQLDSLKIKQAITNVRIQDPLSYITLHY